MKAKLVWEDLFEIDGLPNENIWNIEVGGSGFGNNEDQYYTNRLNNVFIKDSVLTIQALKEDYENRHYTSGKLTTKNKKYMKYGRIVVCAKLPKGKGTWPAIWMLGKNVSDVRWPKCGEIDIMEHVGKCEGEIHFSLHSLENNFKNGQNLTSMVNIENATTMFHEYQIDWKEDEIIFLIDNKECARFTNKHKSNEDHWPFNNEFYLILNCAIGGSWGGEIDDDIFPVSYQFKYIKVYEWEK